MYHQNTLKILPHQYVGMFAVKPSVSSPSLDTSIFHFTKPSLFFPAPNSNLFEFDKPGKSSPASGFNTSAGPGPSHFLSFDLSLGPFHL